jgi:hypothetical protein
MGQSSSHTTRFPVTGFLPVAGIFLSSGVKWLDVGTSGFSAIAADTHDGVNGNAADPFLRDHGLRVTPSAPSSARPCATAAGDACTAVITSTRWKRRSTTSTP